MPSKKVTAVAPRKRNDLFGHVSRLIESAKQKVSVAVNTELVMLYWQIGRSIRNNILHEKRAEYGKEIIISLSLKLTRKYGRGWSRSQLLYCLRSAETFQEKQIGTD